MGPAGKELDPRDNALSNPLTDLIKNPGDLPQEQLPNSEYFSGLRLKDIYGTFTVKPGTSIVTDIPYDFNVHTRIDRDLSRQIAERYGVTSIGVWSSEWKHGQDENGKWGNTIKDPRLVISATMGPPKTNWAPHVGERGAISALAATLATGEKPLVLDVGCAGGFTSKLLAADYNLRVVGIDPRYSDFDQIPRTPGDVRLMDLSIFDALGEFGPARMPQDLERIKEILEKIRGSFANRSELYFWGMQHGLGMSYEDFDKEVAELRSLAGRYEQQSPVDLVLCSFMTTGTDLTLAIRDGIRPKAIVYVAPMNGLSGVGNYYFEAEGYNNKGRGLENKVTSFNPGGEYQTIAHWQTFWSDDWGRSAYEQPLAIEPAEVIVQVRKDFKRSKSASLPMVRTYGWDEAISEIISKERAKDKKYRMNNIAFFDGVSDVDAFVRGGNRIVTRLLGRG